jgi:hypothetical protein
LPSRPKQCADHPIKFYSRSDDQVQFKITPGLPDKQDRSKYAIFLALARTHTLARTDDATPRGKRHTAWQTPHRVANAARQFVRLGMPEKIDDNTKSSGRTRKIYLTKFSPEYENYGFRSGKRFTRNLASDHTPAYPYTPLDTHSPGTRTHLQTHALLAHDTTRHVHARTRAIYFSRSSLTTNIFLFQKIRLLHLPPLPAVHYLSPTRFIPTPHCQLPLPTPP